jgi:hypothetical protein
MSTFELKKTSFKDKDVSNDKGMVTLRVPMIWLDTFKEHTGETLTEAKNKKCWMIPEVVN